MADMDARRLRVLCCGGVIVAVLAGCAAVFKTIVASEPVMNLSGYLKDGSGSITGKEHAERILSFPQLYREPPPHDGTLYRAAGEGDHVVAHLKSSSGGNDRQPAMLSRNRGASNWELVAAWTNGDKILISRLAHNATEWTAPVTDALPAKIKKLNPVWIPSRAAAMARHGESPAWAQSFPDALMFNTEGKGGKLRVQIQYTLRSFDNQGDLRKASHSLSHAKDVSSLASLAITAPPLVGIKNEWLLPVNGPDGSSALMWTVSPFLDEELRLQWAPGPTGHIIASDAKGSRATNPSIIRLLDSRLNPSRFLVAFFQPHDSMNIWRSVSHNDGRAWTPLERTILPSSEHPLQAITLISGHVAIVFSNNAGKPEKFDTKSWPLSIALSEDGGQTWPFVKDLMTEFEPRFLYSHPSLVQSGDGRIHIMFSVPGAIRYQQITEDWVKEQRALPSHGAYSCDVRLGNCKHQVPDAKVRS